MSRINYQDNFISNFLFIIQEIYMKKNQNLDTEYAFFASSNGYDGFNSYFDNVFSSRNFERVFVLKGLQIP